MLLEELIQQHRIDLCVADRFGLALFIASYQIGIDLRYFLSDQAKGAPLGCVILFVVTKTYRLERRRLLRSFCPSAGCHALKLARRSVEIATAKSAAVGYRNIVGIDADDGLDIGVDLSDKTTVVDVRATSADGNNVIGRANAAPGKHTQGDVSEAGSVVNERLITVGCIVAAGRVEKKGFKAVGRVEVTSDVVKERVITVGRIVRTGGVAKKCHGCIRWPCC